jgi:hypothetical protein
MSPTGRAGPTRRDPACYLKSLLKIVYVYTRRGPALLAEISLLFTRDLAYSRAGIFSYKRSREAGPPSRAE